MILDLPKEKYWMGSHGEFIGKQLPFSVIWLHEEANKTYHCTALLDLTEFSRELK